MSRTRSDFTRNVFTLISGTTVAQAISIGISPILSRMYTTAEFGAFGTFSSVIALLSLVVGGRYEGAILLPKKDEEAANLFALSFFFNFAVSLFFLGAIFVISFFLPYKTSHSELFYWFYLTPVFTFFIGAGQTFNNWYNRRKEYKTMVSYRISNSASNNLYSLSLGFAKIPLNGLIISYLVANIVSVGAFLGNIHNDYRQFKGSVTRLKMIALARRYRRFPLTNSVQAISDAFQTNGVIYFVAAFFSQSVVGVYSFAMRILLVPMNFAGAAMAQVFYQQATETYNNQGDLQALVRNTIRKSALLSLPVLVILVALGPQIFSFVFGPEWYEAGVYARILAPWILLDFMRAPLSQVPIIVGRHNRLLLLSLTSCAIILATMAFTAIVAKDLKTGLYLLTICQSAYNLVLISWIYRISGHKLQR